ncbi:MAG: AAA family ATPase [Phycisphaerales bacterium]|nr:AAA family ATPase [Phycisphaerales bacterium]
MKLKSIRIENFRSFKDETIYIDDYTCLVGPNGAGKSGILTALNVFFRNNASTVTNVFALSEEDFHHRNTKDPVKITLTFSDLSSQAKEDFKHYYRQGELTVSAKAEWDSNTEKAEVKQYGARLVMKDFATFFEANNKGDRVADLKDIYAQIQKKYPDLPLPGTKSAMANALRSYEEANQGQCELIEEDNQFYGWSRGASLLGKYIQWVYVPAVKDASTEQEEGSKTALGQLLERTIRTKVDFSTPLTKLREHLENQYKDLIDKQKTVLSDLEVSIQKRLQNWASPAATLSLNWHYNPEQSLIIKEPIAKTAIGEDNFEGEVPRLGHGMQRSFLLSILQELASSDQEYNSTLLLGFEEPELYQHPPQAQHIASVLETMTTKQGGNSQIVITTHSPYFVSARGFESIRLLRKHRDKNCSLVRSTTYANVEKLLATALEEKPSVPSVLMAKLEQILQPSQRELFFTKVAILVEGIEDIAFIATHLQLTQKWERFRELGCHFIVANGKRSLSRPLAIAFELEIPTFVAFDSDANNTGKQKENRRDNSCVLRLCGLKDFDPLPSEDFWHDNVVMWKTQIRSAVREDFGEEVWDAAEKKARETTGFVEGIRGKNSLLIAATLEQLAKEEKRSGVLGRLCDQILTFSTGASK